MKKRDENRFNMYFQKYYNPLCNFAHRILHDDALAQDVVQDVFTHLWGQRKVVQIPDNEKSYLFQAVKNKCFEILRKLKSESKITEQHFLQQQQVYEIGFEESVEQTLIKEQLMRCVQQLPPKCREVFVMNKIEGLTQREIADNMNISIKTVENQMGKAYRLLRSALLKENPELLQKFN